MVRRFSPTTMKFIIVFLHVWTSGDNNNSTKPGRRRDRAVTFPFCVGELQKSAASKCLHTGATLPQSLWAADPSPFNRRRSCHSVRTQDAAASQPAWLLDACLLSGFRLLHYSDCLWSEDLWYNEETPLEVEKWTVIVMILQDKWTGYIRSLIPVRVAPICTCIYFAGNKVIRHPDDHGRAPLLVKWDYLEWGNAEEEL